nr:hypothetical protein Iba_chr10cCG13840 [Ipomoea batatas]
MAAGSCGDLLTSFFAIGKLYSNLDDNLATVHAGRSGSESANSVPLFCSGNGTTDSIGTFRDRVAALLLSNSHGTLGKVVANRATCSSSSRSETTLGLRPTSTIGSEDQEMHPIAWVIAMLSASADHLRAKMGCQCRAPCSSVLMVPVPRPYLSYELFAFWSSESSSFVFDHGVKGLLPASERSMWLKTPPLLINRIYSFQMETVAGQVIIVLPVSSRNSKISF